MSTRTQEEGRSYYTEHDFNYVPSEFADGSDIRENIEWQRKLLWATRIGVVTFDRSGLGPIVRPDSPILELTARHPRLQTNTSRPLNAIIRMDKVGTAVGASFTMTEQIQPWSKTDIYRTGITRNQLALGKFVLYPRATYSPGSSAGVGNPTIEDDKTEFFGVARPPAPVFHDPVEPWFIPRYANGSLGNARLYLQVDFADAKSPNAVADQIRMTIYGADGQQVSTRMLFKNAEGLWGNVFSTNDYDPRGGNTAKICAVGIEHGFTGAGTYSQIIPITFKNV
jgi:hypothetical protein